MQPTETFTLKAKDGTSLFVRSWQPATPPQAILMIIHGLSEHAARYPHVVRAFTQAGYVVWGHDHRGYGHSGGRRGDYRQFADILADIDTVVETVRSRYPTLPLGFYAHSLGGMYATHYLAQHENKIGAALLSAPGYGPGPDFKRSQMILARVLSLVAPGLRIDTSDPDAPFTLSHDPAAKQAYEEDTLIHHHVSMRFVSTNMRKGQEARRLLARLHLPVRVILGEQDSTIDQEAIRQAVAAAGENVHLKVYAGGFHELHNEIPAIRDAMLQDALQWFASVWWA